MPAAAFCRFGAANHALRAAGALGLCVALTSACSLVNTIDTCEAPEQDRQVNSTTSGDQYPSSRALARLPSGLFVAAWVSESDITSGMGSHVRATLLRGDGTVVAPCNNVNGGGDLVISTAPDREVTHPAVAVGTTPSSPVFIVWTSTPIGGGRREILVRLLHQDLCDFNESGGKTTIFTVSNDDDNGNAARPTVAVRADGREALVAWTSIGSPSFMRSRPVGISHSANGVLEANACDGMSAPCTHAKVGTVGPPAIIPFGTGYALAWTELRADGIMGFDVRLQLLDSLGAMISDHRGSRSFGNVGAVGLALAATGSQLFLAQGADRKPSATAPVDDYGIFLERFDQSGASLGPPQRLNPPPAGTEIQPALAVVADQALFLAWTNADVAGTPGDVSGRVLDLTGRPLFSGMACDTSAFSLSSMAGTRRLGPSLASDGMNVLALFGDRATAPGGSDVFGLSVHARRFDLAHLVPTLR
jgi:hypothetical protein